MAHLKNIEEWCQAPACEAKAKVELFSGGHSNDSHGKFCLRCGKVKLRLLDKQEDEVQTALDHGERY